MLLSDSRLVKILEEGEYLTSEQLKKAVEKATSEKISLYEAILDKDLLSDENLGKIIADFYKIPFVSLSLVTIPQEVLNIIPEEVAKKQRVIIFSQTREGLKAATSMPENKEALRFVEKKTGMPVRVYFATDKDITNAFRLYKKQLQEKFDEFLKEQLSVESKSQIKEVSIAKVVDLLIEYAYYNKASDIHIEPRAIDSLTRFRIDGVLHDVLNIDKSFHTQLITRIKVLSRLRTDEHLSSQDGKMRMHLGDEELDVRVSIVPVVQGEDAVLRLLSSKSRQFSLSDLGMNENSLEKIKTAYKKPYGMILVTGPTGSGKTTTMYAILKILNTREKNIATIEDPVEYEIKGLKQIQVNPKTNLTFADGLRSILRQDPDIIFVGEIRDAETADIAINSAMTGHLVLSTLHTNDAPTALPRLIDMKIEPFLVASTVNIIVAQRLVRKICSNCRVSYTVYKEDLKNHFPEALITKYFGKSREIRMYRGKGCGVCHETGYSGRIGIFEMMEITEKSKKQISEKADAEAIKMQALKEGMTVMSEDGLSKVQQGITTIEEVLRVTKE